MRLRCSPWLLGLAVYSCQLWGQVPLEVLSASHRAWAQTILHKPDFAFETRTEPVNVRFAIMEQLFDHPRLAAAMWRHCQFVPALFATEHPGDQLTIDDGRGLRGTLTLAYRKPGMRVYLVDGRVEKGRMSNPFAVGAKMVVVYHYWEGPQGFESHLQTWTSLDSALLSVLSRPFRSYIRRRQQEFIAYINGNIAKGGAFAQLDPLEFRGPIQREGDPVAIRQYERIFGATSRKEPGARTGRPNGQRG